MAISASFNPGTGILTAIGDDAANAVRVSRDSSGKLLINDGTTSITGGDPTIADTSLIEIFGQGGNDTITLDETRGPLPAAELFGGDGNDVLTGGADADLLFGQSGNDTLNGGGGNDLLFGGDGNDVLTGGAGDDQVFGQSGNDLMIWNPGDGSDLFEGGDGNDTAQVNGGNGSETFQIAANGTRVLFTAGGTNPFTLDIGTTENLVLHAGGGDDVITAGNGLAGLIQLTLDGGAGNDTITGGDGNDTLIGGDGNDVVIGGRGSDVAQLGAGDDVFIWNPGDGSDVVQGGSGFDTLQFNGANVAEHIAISRSGSGVTFTRDVANITMSLDSIERVQFTARGGADNIVVGDLSNTSVQQVAIDLSGIPGSGMGDGASDTVILNGTNGGNQISIIGTGGSVSVTGLAASVTITGSEGTLDLLQINALGGNDTITAAGLGAELLNLTVDGGDGNDVIVGSDGSDVLIGGNGNDVITGGRGNDVAFLGAGNDRFIWNPGDGSDTIEGQDGIDTLQFNGSNASENISLSANGSRATLFRDVGNVTMDLNGVENIQLAASGGADNIVVNDLTGTGIQKVAIDLASSAVPASGDGQPDQVFISGTGGDDHIQIAGSPGSITVSGLAAPVTIAHPDAALDTLTINGGAGSDVINASLLQAGTVNLVLHGGDGDDTLVGSAGNDLVFGDRGNDVAFLGAGDDTYVWNPGDGSDTVDGQAGVDTLLFNGANVSENIQISANGARAELFRDVANINMDLHSVENIQLRTLGGSDNVVVNDLTGTGVKSVAVDLGSSIGGGDGHRIRWSSTERAAPMSSQ